MLSHGAGGRKREKHTCTGYSAYVEIFAPETRDAPGGIGGGRCATGCQRESI